MSDAYNVKSIKCNVNNHKTFKKYNQHRDPMTNMIMLETESFKLRRLGQSKPHHTYYGVRVVTGNQEEAGTASRVYMELIGENGRTGHLRLGFYFQFVKSSDPTYDDYIVECDGDLGEVQLVTIGNDGFRVLKSSAIWYVDYSYVINFKTNREQNFPCYHWIGSDDYFTCAANCDILQHLQDNPILIEQRRLQITARKNTYPWEYFKDSGFPSAIDIDENASPPLDEKFEYVKSQNFTGNFFKGFVFGKFGGVFKSMQQALSKLIRRQVNDFETMENLHGFYDIAKVLMLEEIKYAPSHHHNSDLDINKLICYEAFRWTSDVEFGRQVLNGVNCVVIKRCSPLPDNFPVTNEMVQHSLTRGVKLEQEIQDGYVYISDLSEIMDGLPCQEGYHCAAPLCLLYVNSMNKLVPIAIQLKRLPAEDNPIFLPTDGWIDWLLAKMYFASASAQHHQLSTHFITCHAAMEAYGVATMRTIPDAHPVYKLLRPAFRYTIAINTKARENLVNDGGFIDDVFAIGGKGDASGKNELIRRANEKYSVHWSNIKKNLADRKVNDPNKLPNYYYRDDGLRLWDAMESFVKSIIDLFYNDDTDVQQDSELKEWAKEINNYAFPAFKSQPMGRGFPEVITSKNELIEYCTLIMFTGSVQHTAINFGQFQMYSYVPNAPFNMRNPPPTHKGVATERHLLESLPTILATGISVMVVFSLSQFSPDEIFLGGYPTMWYTAENEKACVKKYRESLAAINADIIERNNKQEVPYKYLLPQRCPNSITI